jgi:hypothetical protein
MTTFMQNPKSADHPKKSAGGPGQTAPHTTTHLTPTNLQRLQAERKHYLERLHWAYVALSVDELLEFLAIECADDGHR